MSVINCVCSAAEDQLSPWQLEMIGCGFWGSSGGIADSFCYSKLPSGPPPCPMPHPTPCSPHNSAQRSSASMTSLKRHSVQDLEAFADGELLCDVRSEGMQHRKPQVSSGASS